MSPSPGAVPGAPNEIPPTPQEAGGDNNGGSNAPPAGGRGNPGRGGRGRGRGGRGGRGHPARPTQPRFKGREPTMEGHIFDFNGERNGTQFNRTKKEIMLHTVRTYNGDKDHYPKVYRAAIDALEIEDLPEEIADPEDPQNPLQLERWKRNLAEHEKKVKAYSNFQSTLFSLVLGQCSLAMEERIKQHEDWETTNEDQDGIELLKIIKSIMMGTEVHTHKADAACDALEQFFKATQGKDEKEVTFFERYKGYVNELGDDLSVPPSVVSYMAEIEEDDPDNPDEETIRKARSLFIGVRFLRALNKKHAHYRANVRNSWLKAGNDIYPRNEQEALTIASRWENETLPAPSAGLQGEGLTFPVTGVPRNDLDPEAMNRMNRYPHIKCFRCNRMGHFASSCEFSVDIEDQDTAAQDDHQGQEDGEVHVLVGTAGAGFAFATISKNSIPDDWIVLDTGASIDLFKNKELLSRVYKVKNTSMNVHGNGGSKVTQWMGDLDGHGPVWFDDSSMVNIMSFSLAYKKYNVTLLEDDEGPYFQLLKPDGSGYNFRQDPRTGLFYLNTADPERVYAPKEHTIPEDHDEAEQESSDQMAMVTTVESNKNNYSAYDYSQAEKAKRLYIILNRPSVKDFLSILRHNELRDCDITVKDAMRAIKIWGPDVGALKGKTVRSRPHKVRDVITEIPASIREEYKDLTVAADVLFINGQPMILTIARHIRFATTEELPTRHKKNLIKHFKALSQLAHASGFRIRTALMDREFEDIRDELAALGITLNTTGENEHVGDIERFIRTIKERIRAIWNTLPFKYIPIRLAIEMVKAAVFWWNSLPVRNSVSKWLSPRTIMSGASITYTKHCKHEFGEYVQTHEKTSNDMEPRTIGALATRPTGNAQGTWHYLSLETGRMISRNNATPLPMPTHVVDRVHRMARRQKMDKGVVFTNRSNQPFHHEHDDMEDDPEYQPFGIEAFEDDDYNSDDDEDYVPEQDEYNYEEEDYDEEEDEDYTSDNVADAEHSEDEYNTDDYDEEPPIGNDDNYFGPLAEVDDEEEQDEMNDNNDDQAPEIQGVDAGDGSNLVENQGVDTGDGGDNLIDEFDAAAVDHNNEDDEQDLDEAMDAAYGQRQRDNMRPRRPRDYSHLFYAVGHVFSSVGESTLKPIESSGMDTGAHIATPQVSLKKGIKMFGDEGKAAVHKEVKQLHDVGAVKPVEKKKLTREQLKMALEYLMFLKRKRCGRIKARGCADGRKQRSYIPKEDATSPTAATQAIMMTAVIDALEKRFTAYADVPGAFLQALMSDETHIVIRGEMVEQMLEVDRELYEPYVVYERGEKCLYLEAVMALYGTLKAARLFWELLSKVLVEEWGFTINPYDPCVAHKMVNGKQLTVVWHVDDLKISHEDEAVVREFIDEQLRKRFGRISPLSVADSKRDEYIGMTFDFSHEGKVEVSMDDYVMMMCQDLPKGMIGKAKSPAANHLYRVREVGRNILKEDQKEIFIRLVMQALYLSMRARPDIRTAVSFLNTRLQDPDLDDWRKLGRLMKYLQATPDLPLTLESDGSGKIYWWIDASFAVHPDMKGHTGAMMSLGKGCLYAYSARQKINTRSSTEAEVVGVYDNLPQMEWTEKFLRAQGYDIDCTILYQDNMSAMLLEKNGKWSSSKRTKHMDIRYFYIKDKVDSKTVHIEHCPTKEMLADFFTKPLQGQLFYYLRDFIMNIDQNSKYHSSAQRSVLRSDKNDQGSTE